MKTFLVMTTCLLAVAHGWTCGEAPRLYDVVQVDAGQGKVVARDLEDSAYFLSGGSWSRLGSVKLRQVSVGPSGLWGIDAAHQVVKYIAGDFQQVRGLSLQHVDAGGDGQIIGIESESAETFCLPRGSALAYDGVGALNWIKLAGWLKSCSCSPNGGCWGVETNNEVKFTKGINSSSCVSNSWTGISGLNMKKMKIGADGSVFGVATNGYAYERTGISSAFPHGSGWSIVSQCMRVSDLSYDLGQLWLATTSGLLLRCSR